MSEIIAHTSMDLFGIRASLVKISAAFSLKIKDLQRKAVSIKALLGWTD